MAKTYWDELLDKLSELWRDTDALHGNDYEVWMQMNTTSIVEKSKAFLIFRMPP